MNIRSAISKINKSGVLLVFPINNAKQPDSLWAQFFPKKKLKWEWNEDSDDKVGDMWHLMKRLSDCGKVVYSKWYQSRATFFSLDLFSAMIKILNSQKKASEALSSNAKNILEILEMSSPQSTKEIKKQAELQGKLNEGTYQRATKELFSRLLIVAYGEVDDGAFPSLAIGATKSLYEELWKKAMILSLSEAERILNHYMPPKSLMRRHFEKTLRTAPLKNS